MLSCEFRPRSLHSIVHPWQGFPAQLLIKSTEQREHLHSVKRGFAIEINGLKLFKDPFDKRKYPARIASVKDIL
jgi:hypothetical protein